MPRAWKEEGYGEIGLRKSMEDREVLIQYLNELTKLSNMEPMSFYAVIDGHGGVKAADFVAANLPARLVHNIKASGTSSTFRD